MIEAHLDAASVARVRMAASPVFETATLLGYAAAGRTHPRYGRLGPAARATLADPDVKTAGLLLLGAARGHYMPDFMTPKPTRQPWRRVFSGQLEQIRAISAAEAGAQLDYLSRLPSAPQLPAHSDDPMRIVRSATTGLQKFWLASVSYAWPSMNAAIQRDIDRRSARLSADGIGGLLNSLHTAVTWNGQTLGIDLAYQESSQFHDAELVLVPSILGWPRLSSQVCSPANAMLAYPIAGRPAGRQKSSSELLGGGRSAVLAALEVPRTTRQVSQLVHLSISTVSEHLQVLARAGLLERVRRGRCVEYHQTATARALTASSRRPDAG